MGSRPLPSKHGNCRVVASITEQTPDYRLYGNRWKTAGVYGSRKNDLELE